MHKQKQVFRFIAILLPLAAVVSIYTMPGQMLFDLSKAAIIYDGSFYNKLIGFAFCIVLLAANLYAIGQGKKLELILGNAYAVSAFLCLFAGDFLSLFIGLELMMLFSTAIIFIGGEHSSIRAAKKYFITHFISGSLILLGIIHIISKSKSLALVSAFTLMLDSEYSSVVMSMMLVGMLINIAMFPFSGWVVNYYKAASTSGFIYLISFTTKLSILLLIKLFAGLPILKYFGVMMILYSGSKAIFENNMLKLLCHLSIMSMGLMLMGIGIGSDAAIASVVYYLFIHILYKAMLAICVATIIDTTGIHDCSSLKKIDNKVIIIAAIIGVAMMIAVPATAAFQIKVAISHLFLGEAFYVVLVLSSLVTIYSLPWKNCLKSHESQTILLGNYAKSSLILMSVVLTFIGLFGEQLLFLINNTGFEYTGIFSSESLKQLIIIALGLYLALKYKIKKFHTKSINLIDWLGEACLKLYFRLLGRSDEDTQESESWSIASLEDQISGKLTAAHNQKTAIFIVFVVFLTIVIIFAITSS